MIRKPVKDLEKQIEEMKEKAKALGDLSDWIKALQSPPKPSPT